MARTPQRTQAQNFIVSSGDFILGEDSTTTTGGPVTLRSGDHTGATFAGSGGAMTIRAGNTNAFGNGATAGNLTIQAGNLENTTASGGSSGGDATIAAGDATTGTTGSTAGGDMTLRAGNGRQTGGVLNLLGGNSTIGTGSGGNVVLTAGSSTTLGGGDVNINGGAGVGGTAPGGDVTITSGTNGSSVTYDIGNINLTCPDANPANNVRAGGIFLSAGDNGIRNFNGGDVSLSAGDTNGGTASGRGGDVILATGDALNALGGRGGSVIITLGDAANATFAAGSVSVTGPNNQDEPLFELTNTGTNGSSADVFVGAAVPTHTAPAGSLFLRNDGLTTTGGEAYVQVDASGSNDDGSSWQLLSTGGGKAWLETTTTTTDATPSNLVLQTLADPDQSFADVRIYAQVTGSGADTYSRSQEFLFFRDGGGAVQQAVEKSGTEHRRGALTTATATLAASGNDVVVTVTGQVATSIEWTVQYRTRATV